MRLLDAELDAFRGGALFFYLSSTDQVAHIFWRAMDADAPPQLAGHADVVPELYRRVDRMVGHILERVPEAEIIIMSDHGFASYRRKVHLNSWLATHGYLALREGGDRGPGALGHIDWERTQAYALGLNQLFINRAGRESGGVVSDGDADALIAEIERKLRMFRDPDTGSRVVTQVVRGSGEGFTERVPDLIVGYNKGYRSSDESAIGAVGDVIIEDNTDWWSGDHCMDSRLVPGIIITSFPVDLAGEAPTLADLAPTTLAYFGVELPAPMGGRALIKKGTP
jgi:predicted AlkP superfamily phosphohydrolase/phosphomutase